MIYFLCPDLPYPTGGAKQIHLQATYLQEAGHDVTILYTGSQRPRIWFPTTAPCRLAPPWLGNKNSYRQSIFWLRQAFFKRWNYPLHLKLSPLSILPTNRDLLIVPEIYAAQLGELPPKIPKVILNQNCFLTFHGLNAAPAIGSGCLLHSYMASGVIGHLANSPYVEAYLRWSFPGLAIRTLELGVVSPASVPKLDQRDPIIVFFPRKSVDILQQLFGILRNRGALIGWRLKALEGLSESAVAHEFRQARLYVASSLQEGLGLPPLEAMANGCAVVGFPAWGGDAFVTEAVSRPVRTGDVLSLAVAVEESLIQLMADPSAWQAKVDRARDMVKQHYDPTRAAASSLEAFGAFLNINETN